MAKVGRSARGEIIDFDMLAIQQALADAPAPVSVQARRDFIEEKVTARARPGMVVPGSIVEDSEDTVEDLDMSFEDIREEK